MVEREDETFDRMSFSRLGRILSGDGPSYELLGLHTYAQMLLSERPSIFSDFHFPTPLKREQVKMLRLIGKAVNGDFGTDAQKRGIWLVGYFLFYVTRGTSISEINLLLSEVTRMDALDRLFREVSESHENIPYRLKRIKFFACCVDSARERTDLHEKTRLLSRMRRRLVSACGSVRNFVRRGKNVAPPVAR